MLPNSITSGRTTPIPVNSDLSLLNMSEDFLDESSNEHLPLLIGHDLLLNRWTITKPDLPDQAKPLLIGQDLLLNSWTITQPDREEDMQSILDQVLDMEEGQHRASPSGQATLNAEQSAIMAEAEESKSANATPPIIQPGLPLPASLGVEPKDDWEEDMQSIMQEGQHRASPSGQAALNAEQILALQPEPPPVQFCSGIGFPLISQEYDVTMEFEDLSDQAQRLSDVTLQKSSDPDGTLNVSMLDEMPQQCVKPSTDQEKKRTDPSSDKPSSSSDTNKAEAPATNSYVCCVVLPTDTFQICNEKFLNTSARRRHYKSHGVDKRYGCDICHYTCSAPSIIIKHSRVHTEEKPFVCNLCGKIFAQESNLYTHRRLHTDGKDYNCHVCGKVFRQKIHLSTHKLTHTEKKPYICRVCGKGFRQKIHLIDHQLTHTGDKPYICNICGKGFVQRGNLHRHSIAKHYKNNATTLESGLTTHTAGVMNSNRPITNEESREESNHGNLPSQAQTQTASGQEKKRTDPSSDKPSSSSDMNKAEAPATNSYVCYVVLPTNQICNEKFPNICDRLRHYKSHDVDRRYGCNTCGKAFKTSSHLSIHQYTHTGDKLTCNICGKAFARRWNLNRHTITHAQNNATTLESGLTTHTAGMMNSNRPSNITNEESREESNHGNLPSQAQTQTVSGQEKKRTDPSSDKPSSSSDTNKAEVAATNSYVCCVILPTNQICNEKFSNKCDRLRHYKSHGVDKRYGCNICGKVVTRTDHLKQHQLTHTGNKFYIFNI